MSKDSYHSAMIPPSNTRRDQMEKKESVNAVSRVRKAFAKAGVPQTLLQIQTESGLKASEVSMALCYLKNYRFVTRELVDNPVGKGRAQVWLYSYFPSKVDLKAENAN